MNVECLLPGTMPWPGSLPCHGRLAWSACSRQFCPGWYPGQACVPEQGRWWSRCPGRGSDYPPTQGTPRTFSQPHLALFCKGLNLGESEYMQVIFQRKQPNKVCWCFLAWPDLSTEQRLRCLMTPPSFLLLFPDCPKQTYQKCCKTQQEGSIFYCICAGKKIYS